MAQIVEYSGKAQHYKQKTHREKFHFRKYKFRAITLEVFNQICLVTVCKLFALITSEFSPNLLLWTADGCSDLARQRQKRQQRLTIGQNWRCHDSEPPNTRAAYERPLILYVYHVMHTKVYILDENGHGHGSDFGSLWTTKLICR